jgi:type I restriction enzyme S subunit
MSTATTHIDNKQSLRGTKQSHPFAPELRFNEFKDEWGKKKMGDLTERIGDGLHGTPKYVHESDIHFVNGNNLINGNIFITDKTKKVGENTFLKNDKNLAVNTIFISLNGTIGNIARYNNEKIMLGKSVGYFNFNTDSEYYYHILNSPKVQRFFTSELTGSTIKNLSLKTLRETIIPYPSLPEQQKIASFLSAVDEKIQQLTQKKALLEDYKKGVMQQLFSGQLRFKDENGKDYPDWEEKFFKDIVIEYRLGGNYTNTEEETIYPLIKMGNLGRGKIKLKKLEYIPIDEEIDSKDKIEYGDLFFNTRNTLDLVGKVSIWRNELPEAYYNSNLMYLKFEDNFFMNYRLNSYEGLKGLKRFATGTTSVAAIYTKDLLKLPLNMPCLEEQQKIANYLSGIDTKIEAVNTQITQTQTFKKGLLQQMFV